MADVDTTLVQQVLDLEADGTAQQVVARGRLLNALMKKRPDLSKLLAARIEGNSQFQTLLRDPEGIEGHVEEAHHLVVRMTEAVGRYPYLAGATYSLADAFATAVLARFIIHGLQDWWAETALEGYYARMRSRPSFELAEVIDTGSERDT